MRYTSCIAIHSFCLLWIDHSLSACAEPSGSCHQVDLVGRSHWAILMWVWSSWTISELHMVFGTLGTNPSALGCTSCSPTLRYQCQRFQAPGVGLLELRALCWGAMGICGSAHKGSILLPTYRGLSSFVIGVLYGPQVYVDLE